MSESLYDPVANPYAPGAGTPPPALVGRDDTLAHVDVGLQRLRAARSSQHHLVHGLRGVGKTVLLGKLAALAEHHGYATIRLEAVHGHDTVATFLRQARRIVEELGSGERTRRALRSIEAVGLSAAGTGFELTRDVGRGDPEALTDVIVDLASSAAAHDTGVMVALDEAQVLDLGDLRRLLAGVHRCGQDGLPLYCVLAGLPNLMGVVARAVTYAERMFATTELGPLSPDEVARAVSQPADDIGVTWSNDALDAIADRSDGYPYFVQIWAHHTWNIASDDPISAADVERAASTVLRSLDSSFFAARIARIPESEIAYVRDLASLGPGPHRSGEIAAVSGRTTSAVAAFRDRLISEGVIFSPRYGWVEFAIPHFDEYVRRTFPVEP